MLILTEIRGNVLQGMFLVINLGFPQSYRRDADVLRFTKIDYRSLTVCSSL